MTILQPNSPNVLAIFFYLFLLLPVLVSCDCKCDAVEDKRHNRTEAIKYKIGAIASLLVASGLGVCIPILGKKFQVLRPENDVFFMIKAFAAGVILSTGFTHILPDAFEKLRSPCLDQNLWKFPFTGFIAMMSAIGTLMVDTFATSFYKRLHFNKAQPVTEDEENAGEHSDHLHVHPHGSNLIGEDSVRSELTRHRIVSQTSVKTCEDCGGSGICAECKGEGFVLKKLSEESAEKARLAAKNMATRYTAGLPKKWSYCTKCSSARSCSTCGGSGQLSV